MYIQCQTQGSRTHSGHFWSHFRYNMLIRESTQFNFTQTPCLIYFLLNTTEDLRALDGDVSPKDGSSKYKSVPKTQHLKTRWPSLKMVIEIQNSNSPPLNHEGREKITRRANQRGQWLLDWKKEAWGVHSHTDKAQSLLLQQEEEIQPVSWKMVLKIIGECGCSREQSPGDPKYTAYLGRPGYCSFPASHPSTAPSAQSPDRPTPPERSL